MESLETGPPGRLVARSGRQITVDEDVNGLVVDGHIRQRRVMDMDVAGDEWKATVELFLIVAGDQCKRHALSLQAIEGEPLVRAGSKVSAKIFLPGGERPLRIERHFNHEPAHEQPVVRPRTTIDILKERDEQ